MKEYTYIVKTINTRILSAQFDKGEYTVTAKNRKDLFTQIMHSDEFSVYDIVSIVRSENLPSKSELKKLQSLCNSYN